MGAGAGGAAGSDCGQPPLRGLREGHMGIAFRTAILFGGSMGAYAQSGGEPRFTVRADPKTLDPLLAEEEVSETIRYLTSGVLIRFNRQTQRLEPELATSWKVASSARQ